MSDLPADRLFTELLPDEQKGAARARLGRVWCFLDQSAGEQSGSGILALTGWVYRNHETLYQMHGNFTSADLAPLLKDCPASEAEVIGMLELPQFGQVLNDLRLMNAGESKITPTVDFICSSLRPDEQSVILDVGCSVGRHLWEVQRAAPALREEPSRCIGLDVDVLAMLAGDETWAAAGRPAPNWVQASALSIPFASGKISHVLSAVTLSFLPIRQALAELARVLCRGGQLILTMEGPGFWRKSWDQARPWSFPRLQLLRWRLGNLLMQMGVDWQANRFSRRLAGMTQYNRGTLSRLVEQAGFVVERCEELVQYGGKPALLGVAARRS